MEERPLLDLLELADARDRLAEEAQALSEQTGLKLRDARHAAGLSQSDFAHLAGVPQPYVSKVENGGSGVSTEQMRHFYSVIATASTSTSTTSKGAEHGSSKKRAKAKAQ